MVSKQESLLKHATLLSVLTAVSLIIIKFYGWVITDSITMQATLIDSVLDALSSIINFVAIRHALNPADEDHKFGHGKIEAIASSGQAIFIITSAIFILTEAFARLYKPTTITHNITSIGIIIFTIIITFILLQYQNYVISQTKSTIVTVDATHFKSDLLVNSLVLVSLFSSKWFNLNIIDTILGAAIACYIIWSAIFILKTSIDILMDHELPIADIETINQIVRSNPDVLGFHDLRTRSTGTQQFIQLHLELPPDMNLQQAHNIATKVEEEIKSRYPNAEIIIHQEAYTET